MGTIQGCKTQSTALLYVLDEEREIKSNRGDRNDGDGQFSFGDSPNSIYSRVFEFARTLIIDALRDRLPC